MRPNEADLANRAAKLSAARDKTRAAREYLASCIEAERYEADALVRMVELRTTLKSEILPSESETSDA